MGHSRCKNHFQTRSFQQEEQLHLIVEISLVGELFFISSGTAFFGLEFEMG